MNLKQAAITSLMCAATLLAAAQKTLSVADITTNNLFNAKGVDTREHLKSDKQSADRFTLRREDVKYIYRRSFTADYTLVDNLTGRETKIEGRLKSPTFAPDGSRLAFVRDNNLYVIALPTDGSKDYDIRETAVTTDGEFSKVINGFADWVYEEEFKRTRMFAFTADGSAIAWVRFDESQVKQYTLQFYENGNYPRDYSFKYPKAGEDNAKVTLHTYRLTADIPQTERHREVTSLPIEEYLPVIESIPGDKENVLVCTMNRHEDEMKVWKTSCLTGACQPLQTVTTNCYLPEETVDNLTLHPDGYVVVNDSTGSLQPYLYSYDGKTCRRLISDDVLLSVFYGYDSATQTSYFQSVGKTPMQRNVCKADKKGKVTVLSTEDGWNTANFSSDYSKYVITHSDILAPPTYTLCSGSGKKRKSTVLEDNAELKERLSEYTLPQKEFFTITTSEGVALNALIYKPADFDAAKRYPVIFFQYSGPGSQQVTDSWTAGSVARGGMYEALLCQQGYICVTVDPRGTTARGADFQKLTYQKLGRLESRDMVEAALYMQKQPFVDSEHLAIWGWSYGGFCTLMSMSEGTPVFRCGVAIAPPTDYRFYDTIYTERFMRTPQENADGYADNPITRAEKLHGDLLLCHGVVDDNVHPQNSYEYMARLVELNKPFDMHWFTNSNHSINNGNSRRFLLEKVLKFFNEKLK